MKQGAVNGQPRKSWNLDIRFFPAAVLVILRVRLSTIIGSAGLLLRQWLHDA